MTDDIIYFRDESVPLMPGVRAMLGVRPRQIVNEPMFWRALALNLGALRAKAELKAPDHPELAKVIEQLAAVVAAHT